MQFVAPAVRLALGLALTAVLGRHLGVAGYGQYALVFSYVATVIGIFNEWGLGAICLREISRRPNERVELLASTAALQALVAIGSYAVLIIGLIMLDYPPAVKQAVAVFGLTIFFSPLDMMALGFQADLRVAKLVGPTVLGTVLNFVLSVAAVLLGGSVLAVVAASVAALVAQYAWVTILTADAWRVALSFHPRKLSAHWLPLLREAWSLGAGAIVSTLLQNGPTIALSFASMEAVGLFNAANKVPQQLVLLPIVLRTSTFPILSRSWTNDPQHFRSFLDRLLVGAFLLSLPATLLGIGLAQPAMTLLFGPSFAPAAEPFAILLTIFAIVCPGILVGEALVAAGAQRLNLWILLASLPLLGGLLYWLVPRSGASGAAIAYVLSYLAISGANVVVLAHRSRSPLVRRVLLPAVGAAVAGFAIMGARGWLGSPLAGAAASLVSICILVVARPAASKELALMVLDLVRIPAARWTQRRRATPSGLTSLP